MKKNLIAAIPPYFAVWLGLFFFNSAWLTLLGFHLGILASLIWLCSDLRISMLLKITKLKYVLLSLLVCFAGGIGLYLFWDIFQVAGDLTEQLSQLGLNAETWPLFIAYFSLVNPFLEEFFWRGVLGNTARGLYFGDLIYAGYHVMVVWNKVSIFSTLAMLAALVFAGWFWRQIYRRDGGLLAPVLGHMIADLSILLTIYTMAGQVLK